MCEVPPWADGHRNILSTRSRCSADDMKNRNTLRATPCESSDDPSTLVEPTAVIIPAGADRRRPRTIDPHVPFVALNSHRTIDLDGAM